MAKKLPALILLLAFPLALGAAGCSGTPTTPSTSESSSWTPPACNAVQDALDHSPTRDAGDLLAVVGRSGTVVHLRGDEVHLLAAQGDDEVALHLPADATATGAALLGERLLIAVATADRAWAIQDVKDGQYRTLASGTTPLGSDRLGPELVATDTAAFWQVSGGDEPGRTLYRIVGDGPAEAVQHGLGQQVFAAGHYVAGDEAMNTDAGQMKLWRIDTLTTPSAAPQPVSTTVPPGLVAGDSDHLVNVASFSRLISRRWDGSEETQLLMRDTIDRVRVDGGFALVKADGALDLVDLASGTVHPLPEVTDGLLARGYLVLQRPSGTIVVETRSLRCR